jgi:hypothetical protein
VRIYCTITGTVVATDRAIATWLGCDASLLVGRELQHLAPEGDDASRGTLAALLQSAAEAASNGGRGLAQVKAEGVALSHKYADPVLVDVNMEMAGT